jgi:tetratricopeptide (TPR) repeat protein
MRSLPLLPWILLGLLRWAPARGEDPFTAHYQRAISLYKERRYEECIRELSAAYELRRLPALLLNLGHAHLDLGQPEQALRYYERYLAEAGTLTPAARADVERYQAQARAQLLARSAPPAPAVQTAPRSRRQIGAASLSLLGAGAAVVAGGVAMGLLSMAAAREVVAGPDAFDADLDWRGRALSGAAITADVVGGALLLAGGGLGVYWLWQRRAR